jgi:hypothetical protein
MNVDLHAGFALFALVFYAVVLGLIAWGFYLMFLLTKALRKYLRN